MDTLGLWACSRAVLRFLITKGRGARCRSWYYTRSIAALLPRSNRVEAYSTAHVRDCLRRELVALGLVRVVDVPMGGRFPHKDFPDDDGNGAMCPFGGKVYEVNVDALLGLAPLWSRELAEPSAPPSSAPELAADDAEDDDQDDGGDGDAEGDGAEPDPDVPTLEALEPADRRALAALAAGGDGGAELDPAPPAPESETRLSEGASQPSAAAVSTADTSAGGGADASRHCPDHSLLRREVKPDPERGARARSAAAAPPPRDSRGSAQDGRESARTPLLGGPLTREGREASAARACAPPEELARAHASAVHGERALRDEVSGAPGPHAADGPRRSMPSERTFVDRETMARTLAQLGARLGWARGRS